MTHITHANYPKVSQYVNTWRKIITIAEEQPDQVLYFGFSGYDKAGTVRKDYISALHSRINTRGNDPHRGKKDCYEYAVNEMRDQQAIRRKVTQRVRFYQFCTSECQKRFSHLLSDRNEE